MHLYLLRRGIQHDVTRMINDLQAQYFQYKYGDKDLFVQLGVRPIQLWEVVMPEDSLKMVMNTVNAGEPKATIFKRAQLELIRKALKAKKMPEYDKTAGKRIIYKDNVAVYPLGIKPDRYDKNGEVLLISLTHVLF